MQNPVVFWRICNGSADLCINIPQIKKVVLSITKIQPPIPGFTGTVGVEYSKEY